MSHAAPPGWRLQISDVLASTQDAALDAARRGDAGRLAVLAREQSAGRGRDGRAWEAPSGNLNLSVLLRPSAMRPQPGFWALLAGVALHAAMAARIPNPVSLQLKWPNDLMFGGAKLGGILIDSAVDASGFIDWLVIGIGVNLATAPAIPGRPTTCAPDAGPPEALAEAILRQVDVWSARDADAVQQTWLAHAHPQGTILHVRTAGGATTGAFAGLSPSGELLLEGLARPIVSAETTLAPCC